MVDPAPRSPRLARNLVRLGISLGIAGFFVWIMQAGALPLVPPRAAFRDLSWGSVVLYLAGFSFVHLLRAGRWQLLLRPITTMSWRRVLAASFLGFLAIVLLPLRAGEVVRPVLVREKGRLSAWAALGTLGAERIVDGFVMCLLLFAGLGLSKPLDPLPDQIGELPIAVALVPRAAYVALLGFTLALLAMVAFYVWKGFARRWFERLVGVLSPRLAVWAAERVSRVADGLSFLSGFRHSAPFIAMTVAYWALNAACTWLLARGVGFDSFSYAQACVVTGVLALGVLLPNAPGFFGAFQFSLYAGLAMFYPKEQVLGPGALLVLLVYVGQNLVTLVFAGWAALFGGYTWSAELLAQPRASS